MGIRATFKLSDVRKILARKIEAVNEATLNTLSFLGEKCVNKARSLNTYRDQTGNLRNSIGYLVVHNGRVVKRGFGRSASVKSATGRTTKGSKDGVLTGRALAEQLASQVTQEWALIVVAGMNYAVKVESKGLDVLTSAEQLAKAELPGLLRQLNADGSR